MLLPTLLTLSLLLVSCTIFDPATAQCTPSMAPPPELRPLDNDANLLPSCSLPSDRDQKSAISETTAQRLALCNSFCINRVFSGDFVRDDEQKQIFPGYPVWLLATQSYLLSDEGTTTDCLVGGNSNGCTTDCNRFTPPFNFFGPTVPGGFLLAQDCKLGCMLQFESPSSSCAEDCRMNCNSVACQCGGLFGDGCFADQAPPCGRECSSTSCGHGCTDATSYTNSTLTYPSSANPTQAPEVTQIGNGTRYMINITNSIPSGVSGDLGYSTLIVRILDLSSTTPDDYTYYVLENGFEFDLAPFACRRIEVSFAIATNQMAVSSYSPSTMLELSLAGPTLPGQLTDFNFTVEQDNRPGFYQHHIIHLEWDPPRNVEFATGYTITLSPSNNPTVCLSATFDLTNGSLTSFTIQSSNNATQPPITNCIYDIQIEVNPRESESAVQKATSVLTYNNPSADNNIVTSCSSVLNRSTTDGAYDLTLSLQLDETFTPAVISAIRNLRASSFQVRDNGDAIVAVTTRRLVELGPNVTQGPVTVDIPFDNFEDLAGGLGYHLSATIEWKTDQLPMSPPVITVNCLTYDVRPIAPDPVENLEITFQQAIPQSDRPGSGTIDRVFITLRYTWTAPEFVGEGITGYQAWLDEVPGPNDQTGNLQQIGLTTSDELRRVFEVSDTNFTLYFQVRARSANTQSQWTDPIPIDVSTLLPPIPDQMTEDDFNVTSFTYEVKSAHEGEDLSLAVLVRLDLLPPDVDNGTITHFDVYLGAVDARNLSSSPQTTSVTNKASDVTMGAASFDPISVSNLDSLVYLQVRGRSNFSSVGEWSEPEILTFVRVSRPTNLQITGPIRDIVRTQSGNNLMISRLRIPLVWTPPSNLDAIDGYDVLISRRATDRAYGDHTGDHVITTVPGVAVPSESSVTLHLSNENTLEAITLSVQVRARASSIFKSGGGEWSTPLNVTIPPQPAPVTEGFGITSFTYEVMNNERVDVDIIMNIRPPAISPPGSITNFQIYVRRNPLNDLQMEIAGSRPNVTSTQSYGEFMSFDSLEVIGNQVSVQVRAISNSGVAGNWSQPQTIIPSDVPPPTILEVRVTRPRRRMMGSDLIVTANVEAMWRPPPDSQVNGFSITGYDGYAGVQRIVEDYGSPASGFSLQMFKAADENGVFSSGDFEFTFANTQLNAEVSLLVQMRTKANIIRDDSGGRWSDELTGKVPSQPSQMTDEDFNIITYKYSLDENQMLTVTLDMMLVTPDIASGTIKQIHISLATSPLNSTTDPMSGYTTVNLTGSTDKPLFRQATVTVPNVKIPAMISLQMRAISDQQAAGHWSTPENILVSQVPSPENITAAVSNVKRDNELRVSMEVFLIWKIPQQFLDQVQRTRRQAAVSDSIDAPTGYEVLIATEDTVGQDYAATPSGVGTFSMTFDGGDGTPLKFPASVTFENAEDLVNDTLFLRMRTITNVTGSGGEWSEPMPLFLAFPLPPPASLTGVIAGTTVPLLLIIVVIIIIIVVIIVFLGIRTKRIKDEYKVKTGEVNWDYDWDRNMPYIAPGMVEGKEPLLDEWEIPTTDVIVEDHLGEGAFGFVFKGIVRGPLRNPKLSSKLKQTIGLPVAIKLLKDTATRKERSDFLTEIEMMKKISEGYNNHIVNLVGCVTIQEPLCLITEFVPHGDLLDYLRNQRKKNAAKRRQTRLLQMHKIEQESKREYYEDMIRQAKITQSAQSEDSDTTGHMTGGSGYAEMLALRDLDTPQDSSEQATANGEPAVTVQETQIDQTSEGDGVAVIGEMELPQDSSEMKLLKEESRESRPETGEESDRGVFNPISEEVDNYPDAPAPYLEPKNQYSHLDPATAAQGETADHLEDEELLRLLQQTEEIGELEATDLMQFAYQIASGMEYLASLNIVHRDLACRNILVGEGKTLKITDFGLSREVEEVYVKKTKGRLPLKWMAIESIDAREFTTASDVWSYGVVLWEIGTLGGFPYPTVPNQDLLTMLKQGHRLEKPDNCAPEVYEIMLECWQEYPNDRPTFSQLRTKFSTLLLANVDDPYMVLEVDDAKAYYTVPEEETSEQRESVSSNDSDSSIKKKKGPPKKPVWAKPSNPYVDTPALNKEVSITVEEEAAQQNADTAAVTSTTQQEGVGEGGVLGVPESNVDGFDPYIKMKSSPVTVQKQMSEVPQPTQEDLDMSSNQQPISMSLPAEPSIGVSISMFTEEKVAAHQPAKRIRSNPYVDDPGRRQPLDIVEEGENVNGIGNKLSAIAENGTTEGLIVREP